MNPFFNKLRQIKNSSAFLRRIYSRLKNATEITALKNNDDYQTKLIAEQEIYKNVIDINHLPEIFHYWSNKYLRPMLEEYGFSNPDQFFAKYLAESTQITGDANPVFISIGAGNCDTEVRVARLLKTSGLSNFTIECLDMNPYMLQRGRDMAEREGVLEHLAFVEGDFNQWQPSKSYTAVMANQSLHHVLNLEGLFDQIKNSLAPKGYFIASDMIGRNGHMRWPEALEAVQNFWQELPKDYRYNHQLKRMEEQYENWDCSVESFEGIRAQDILPLLVKRFEFYLFIGFANVVDIFTDRSFGHNFKVEQEWDKDFIDRVHAFDELSLQKGTIKPTHMMAVMTSASNSKRFYSRDLSPEKALRL